MSKVKQNIISMMLGKGGASLISFIVLPLYLPLLGKEAFGLVGLSLAFSQILLLLNSSIYPVLVTQVSKNIARGNSSWEILRMSEYICMVSLFILMVIGLSCADYIIDGMDFKEITAEKASLYVKLIMVTVGFNIFYGAYGSFVFGSQNGIWCSSVEFVRAALSSIGGYIVLLIFNGDPMSYFLWLLIVGAAITIYSGYVAWKSEKKHFCKLAVSWASLKEFHSVALASVAVTGVCALIVFLERWGVGVCISASAVGAFVLLFTPMQLISNISSMVRFAILPRLAETVENEKSNAFRIFVKGVMFTSLLYLPCAFLMSFFYEQFFSLWLRDSNIELEMRQLMPLVLLLGFAEMYMESIRGYTLSNGKVIQRLPFAIFGAVVIFGTIIIYPEWFTIYHLLLFRLVMSFAEAVYLLNLNNEGKLTKNIKITWDLLLLPVVAASMLYVGIHSLELDTGIIKILLVAVALAAVMVVSNSQRMALKEIYELVKKKKFSASK